MKDASVIRVRMAASAAWMMRLIKRLCLIIPLAVAIVLVPVLLVGGILVSGATGESDDAVLLVAAAQAMLWLGVGTLGYFLSDRAAEWFDGLSEING